MERITSMVAANPSNLNVMLYVSSETFPFVLAKDASNIIGTMEYFVWVTCFDIQFSTGFGSFAGVSVSEHFQMNIAATDQLATTH